MRQSLQKLKAVVTHPWTQLLTGAALLASGVSGVYIDFVDAEHSFRLGAHHGVLVLGLTQVLGSLPELVDGLERTFKAADDHQEQRRHAKDATGAKTGS